MQAASDLKTVCKDDLHTKENMKVANGLLQRLLNIATEVIYIQFHFAYRVNVLQKLALFSLEIVWQ